MPVDLAPLQIEDVMKNQWIGRLGCSLNGETYIVPISYAYDGNYIYCHTHEGKKINMMRANPLVCFQIDEMKNITQWKSVVIQGQFHELHSREERNKAIQILLNRYLPVLPSISTHIGDHWPFHGSDSSDIGGIVFRITIQEKAGKFEDAVHTHDLPGWL